MKRTVSLIVLVFAVLLVNGQVVNKDNKPLWASSSKQQEVSKDSLKKLSAPTDSIQAHVKATDCARCGKRDIMPLHRCTKHPIKNPTADLQPGVSYELSDGKINGQKRVLSISEIKALLNTKYSEFILKYILEYNPDGLILNLTRTTGENVSIPVSVENNGYLYVNTAKAKKSGLLKSGVYMPKAYIGHVTLLR
jgi:hypothetical protein